MGGGRRSPAALLEGAPDDGWHPVGIIKHVPDRVRPGGILVLFAVQFLFAQLFLLKHGGGAEEQAADVSEGGGFPCREALGDGGDQDLGKGLVDVRGGGKLGASAEYGGGEVGGGVGFAVSFIVGIAKRGAADRGELALAAGAIAVLASGYLIW